MFEADTNHKDRKKDIFVGNLVQVGFNKWVGGWVVGSPVTGFEADAPQSRNHKETNQTLYHALRGPWRLATIHGGTIRLYSTKL